MDNTLLQRCYDELLAVDNRAPCPPGGATRARLRLELLDAIEEPGGFFETLSTRSDDDLLTARNKIDIELRKRCKVSGMTKLFSMGDDGLPIALNFENILPSSQLPSSPAISWEKVRGAMDDRDRVLETRLRAAGPGHAIGYRLLPEPPSYSSRGILPHVINLVWQTKIIKLDEHGNLPPVDTDGWCYVTLREWKA